MLHHIKIVLLAKRGRPSSQQTVGGIVMSLLLSGSGSSSFLILIAYIVIFGAFMYFIAIRPQRKEQKRLQAMLHDMAVGDSIVTTSGFYGVIIDITEDDVIVEFGSNRNCRIPMRKSAIAEVEKANA